MSANPLNPLTKYEENICVWGGVFGALLGGACFLQLFYYFYFTWITWMLLIFDLIIITGFIFVALQHIAGIILIIVNAVLAMACEMTFVYNKASSDLVMLLALYSIGVAVFIYVEHIPAKLKEKQRLQREEEEQWRGKI